MSTTPVVAHVVGAGLCVRGHVAGTGNLLVGGRWEGDLELDGDLEVTEEGALEGTVRVRRAKVAGVLVGDVFAAEGVHLTATSRVEGNITAPHVMLDEGASFRGHLLTGTASSETARRSSSAARAPATPPRSARLALHDALETTGPGPKGKRGLRAVPVPSGDDELHGLARPGPASPKGDEVRQPKRRALRGAVDATEPPAAKGLPRKHKTPVVVKRRRSE